VGYSQATHASPCQAEAFDWPLTSPCDINSEEQEWIRWLSSGRSVTCRHDVPKVARDADRTYKADVGGSKPSAPTLRSAEMAVKAQVREAFPIWAFVVPAVCPRSRRNVDRAVDHRQDRGRPPGRPGRRPAGPGRPGDHRG